MRPITSPMLQQNNNNNYPCLTAAGPGQALPKCPRAALPFPTRLELGLADMPLIRGLRAWALCSKNHHKTGGLLGRAPTAPPANSCPRPADVYLSTEWGGYGLPLGLDGRQAGLGALVTVATLKTSEGSGKTQTQCLFLRTEKGSCLYPVAKPFSAGTGPGSRGVAGGWLRGKTRGTQTPASHTGVHRARERSGRRWRKSGNNTSGREKAYMRQQLQDEPMMASTDEERLEEPYKTGSGCGQEIQETCKNPRSCQNISPKICTPRPAQGESPRRGAPSRLRDEMSGVKKREEDDDKDRIECSSSLAVSKPDLESNVTAMKEESTPELETKIIHYDYATAEKHQEVKDIETALTCSKVPDCINCSESITANADGISDQVEAEDKRVERESVMSSLCDPARTSDCVNSAAPVEGGICKAKSKEADHGIVSQFCKCKLQKSNCEHEYAIVDDEKTCTTVISDENNMEMEAASPVSCGESLANQCFSTHSNRKQTELKEKTEQMNDVDNETVKGWANMEIKVKRESTNSSISNWKSNVENKKYHREKNNTEVYTNCADPSHTLSPPANPAPPPMPLDSKATGRPTLERTGQEGTPGEDNRGPKVDKRPNQELDEPELQRPEQRIQSLDTKTGHQLEDEEFGGFMQAEAQSGWSENFCESHEYTNHKWSYGTQSGTHSCLDQSDDSWAVFPRGWTENREDMAGQWWPHSSVEDSGHAGGNSLGLASVFTAAFPSFPAFSSCDPYDPTVLTLTQLLRGIHGHEGACQDQGLLDTFHDLNKMIGQRYKRASGVSCDLLLKSLHLEPPVPESSPGPSAAHRHLSPGLLSAYQHAPNATAKRRLSYDYNRNIMD